MARSVKLHTSSLFYIILCLLGIAAFCVVGIIPNIQTMKELDASVVNLTKQVQRQELLFPIYSRLLKEVKERPKTLPLPQSLKLPSKDISQVGRLFIDIAKKNNVFFDSAAPDAKSYLEESGFLTMNLVFHGDFFNFQNLLIDICQVPYLISIDELGIYPHTDGKQIRLKIRLDQE